MAVVLPNSVFIHVRKTGGTWVRTAIKEMKIPNEENGPYDCEYHAGIFNLPLFLAERFTWGFVRHPVAWLKSSWAWAVLTEFPWKRTCRPAAAGHWFASCWDEQFEQFVLKYLDTYPGQVSRAQLHPLGFQKTADGYSRSRFAADFIGRYESLEADMIEALRTAGEQFDSQSCRGVARQRVGAQGPLEDACRIDKRLEGRILQAEKPLCDLFGYS